MRSTEGVSEMWVTSLRNGGAKPSTAKRSRMLGLAVVFGALNMGACAISLVTRGAWVFPFQLGIFCCSVMLLLVAFVARWNMLGGYGFVARENGKPVVQWRGVARLAVVFPILSAVVLGAFFLDEKGWTFFFLLGEFLCAVSMIMLRFWVEWWIDPEAAT
jgi:hypothetical protein